MKLLFHSEIYILYCIDLSASVQVGTYQGRRAGGVEPLLQPEPCGVRR